LKSERERGVCLDDREIFRLATHIFVVIRESNKGARVGNDGLKALGWRRSVIGYHGSVNKLTPLGRVREGKGNLEDSNESSAVI
jgi:hypothetical protein